MNVLLGSQTKNNLFHPPRKHEELKPYELSAQLLITSPVYTEPELEADDSKILKPSLEPLCTKQITEYLQVNNNLSEFKSESSKRLARQNIGIPDAVDQIKYSLKNNDIALNSDYISAINNVLDGTSIKSVEDALSVILYSIFPITYTDWNMQIINTANQYYTIETGTKQTINLNETLGYIQIELSPGNKNDIPIKLLVDGKNILQSNILEYKLPIGISEVTDNSQIDSTVSKPIRIYLETDSGYQIDKTVTVGINITKQSYYFQNTYDEYVDIENIPTDLTKTTSNVCIFKLGSDKKWVSVFSPKNITKVETATSTDGINWGTYFITTGYFKTPVYYTPKNGSTQNYYRITLNTKQSAYIKIRVT